MMLNEFGQNLTKNIKVEYAKAIVQLFPKLKDPTSSKGGYEIFYDDSQKTPSGYLAWRLRTVMRSRGNIRKRKCDDGIENRVPFKKPKNIEISTEEERDIEFLKNSNYKTQKEEIFKKMKSTINVRKQRNFTLDDFPRFLDTDGLIHQDFNLLYPDSCPFAPKFEKYLDIIFKVYDKTACSKSSLIDGTVSGWDKPTRALLALLHMLPATAKGKKVGRRDSFESSVDKLLIFCTVGEPLQRIVDERKGFQPYLIGIGANKAAISEYKVVIDSKIVDTRCNNIIESFDFLFKCYFVFKYKLIPSYLRTLNFYFNNE
ncbi:unnamed protein product [Ceutorhynchus assimilis]|uniref:Uncharacterized protein n=1 Tax=Ceutorhynchus assimilis TaxID=467358 RepID=A0A9N9QRF8_9CUCU|nr:unnamed protein product [Ceutorhynchus assimilis]